MPSIEALSGKPHFRRVYASGRRCSRDGVTVVACPRDEGPVRLGLSVGRSAGKAVVRNRIRRRLRAAVRGYGPRPADIVVVGREPVYAAPFAQVEEYVNECLARVGVARA
ncbi:MAG TPA: ribonuclease P protein component [Actinomycetota bacterium]|nr:ribonuclease P protein component [Actinomycetota bacterium]